MIFQQIITQYIVDIEQTIIKINLFKIEIEILYIHIYKKQVFYKFDKFDFCINFIIGYLTKIKNYSLLIYRYCIQIATVIGYC